MLGKFINKLEEKGYRCDYIVTHCYWYSDWSSWKSQLSGIHNDYPGRQIWITEMNYGANWTGWPGSGTSGTSANYSLEKQHFAPIIDGLESTDFIERYAVYNNVQECRYMFKSPDGNEYDNTLTPMGEYYANKASGIGYKADLNSYVPNTSKWMKNPLMTSAVNDEIQHAICRVEEMESQFEQLAQAVSELSAALDKYADAGDSLKVLDAYYGSDEWKSDFAVAALV